MELGTVIQHFRFTKARETQTVFAKKIGITQTYLSQIENNLKQPSTGLLQKIADSLKIPLPALLLFALTEKDVAPRKKDAFRLLKPMINEMIEGLF